jgi:hypothetical protein
MPLKSILFEKATVKDQKYCDPEWVKIYQKYGKYKLNWCSLG